MKAVVLLSLCLAFAGVVVAVAPTASACEVVTPSDVKDCVNDAWANVREAACEVTGTCP